MGKIYIEHPFEGLLKIGCMIPEGFKIGLPFSFEAPIFLVAGLGSNVKIGAFSYTASKLSNCKIGRYCSIAEDVKILGNHPQNWLSTHPFQYVENFYSDFVDVFPKNNRPPPYKKSLSFNCYPTVIIGNDVWIGNDVKFCSNINIGTGAIIAAGAVVTKDVPPYAIVGGVPAKIIKYRFDEHQRKILLRSRWWRYDITQLDLDFQNPLVAVSQIKELAKAKQIDIWNPGWQTIQ